MAKDRDKLRRSIFASILLNGIETSKGDILSDDPIEDKVYTKRINIGKDYGNGVNAVEVVCVSITSDSNKWGDINNNSVKIKNVRINTKNNQGKWCNIFINEAPTEMLEFIYTNIPNNFRIKV